MDKLTAYWRGHYRLEIEHTNYSELPPEYWISVIDVLGFWTVKVED